MTAASAPERLIEMLEESRARTLELVAGLDRDQLIGPRLKVVNPLLWEIGHLAWFHEHFILRGLDGCDPLIGGADALYDSAAVAHDDRWSLPLPSLDDTLDYMARVHRALVARLTRPIASAEEADLYHLTSYHEAMHDEAFTYTRQTLAYPAPVFAGTPDDPDAGSGAWPGDAAIPGGTFQLGSTPGDRFVFDNEKWAHAVAVAPFRMARAPVTNAAFAAFVADGGYRDRRHWSEEGWRWRTHAGAAHPVYWQPESDGGWAVRRFDRIETLAPHQPVIHVNWHEANAWCRWAGRRLPTEIEWEVAASAEPAPDGGIAPRKRLYPWGDEAPSARHANLDGHRLGCVDVAAFPAGDSPWGCRQMLGNVWEWTDSVFEPYPGFTPDRYADYSAPWFGTRNVLRGGAWATRARMISTTYRNFFTPERRDVLAGFRTVAA